jgi:hypothetical protein
MPLRARRGEAMPGRKRDPSFYFDSFCLSLGANSLYQLTVRYITDLPRIRACVLHARCTNNVIARVHVRFNVSVRIYSDLLSRSKRHEVFKFWLSFPFVFLALVLISFGWLYELMRQMFDLDH